MILNNNTYKIKIAFIIVIIISLISQNIVNIVIAKCIPEDKIESQTDIVKIDIEEFNSFNLANKSTLISYIELENLTQETPIKNEPILSKSSYFENNTDYLLNLEHPDVNYNGTVVNLSEEERNLIELKIMGEAGNQGFIGACLVGQTIRDGLTIYNNADTLFSALKYSGLTNKEPNEDVINAVKYIFDEGKSAVQHRLMYFYNPELCNSDFHESQNFIIEYKNHKFFDRWN